MSRLSDTTFPNPFFLAVKMRCITSMGIKIFTIDVAGQCDSLRNGTNTTFLKAPSFLKNTQLYVVLQNAIEKLKNKENNFLIFHY